MNNFIISVLRTIVAPVLVGLLAQFLILLSVEDPTDEVRLGVIALAAAVWYLFARFLQVRWPQFGFLLIVAARPDYTGDETDRGDDLVLSVQRTFVPLAVGWSVTLLARWGLDIDETSISIVLQGGFSLAYYGILRWIEEQTTQTTAPNNVAGLMLGGIKQPSY